MKCRRLEVLIFRFNNKGRLSGITDFIGEKVWFDDAGAGYIWGKEKDGGCQMIGEVRGWGAI